MRIGHLHSLDQKIQNIWESLGNIGSKYVLIGGTALAWHLGHRVSYDIDLATSGPVEHPRVLRAKWGHESIGKHKWIRRSPDHYIKFFPTEAAPKIDVHGKVPSGCLDLPVVASNGLRIASLTDLLKQKLVALCAREEDRDAEDVCALLADTRVNVTLAISALRDESGIGIGAEETEILAERLLDLRSSPWHRFEGLSALVPRLLSDQTVPLKVLSEHVQGPDDLGLYASRTF